MTREKQVLKLGVLDHTLVPDTISVHVANEGRVRSAYYHPELASRVGRATLVSVANNPGFSKAQLVQLPSREGERFPLVGIKIFNASSDANELIVPVTSGSVASLAMRVGGFSDIITAGIKFCFGDGAMASVILAEDELDKSRVEFGEDDLELARNIDELDSEQYISHAVVGTNAQITFFNGFYGSLQMFYSGGYSTDIKPTNRSFFYFSFPDEERGGEYVNLMSDNRIFVLKNYWSGKSKIQSFADVYYDMNNSSNVPYNGSYKVVTESLPRGISTLPQAGKIFKPEETATNMAASFSSRPSVHPMGLAAYHRDNVAMTSTESTKAHVLVTNGLRRIITPYY